MPDLGQGTGRDFHPTNIKFHRGKERGRGGKGKGIKERTLNLPSNRNLHYTQVLSRIPRNGVAYLTRHIPLARRTKRTLMRGEKEARLERACRVTRKEEGTKGRRREEEARDSDVIVTSCFYLPFD